MWDEQTKLNYCQEQIGYRFRNENLLKTALTHTSCALTPVESNERMEFLGDSILGMVIAEKIYHLFPDFLEGKLSIIRGNVVSRRTCARIAQNLGLEDALFLGKGIHRVPDSLLANVIEAIVAAIYLDAGWEACRVFIERIFREELEKGAQEADGENFKSLLQYETQHRDLPVNPRYVLLDEKGPDHCKCFKIQVQIGDRHFQAAWGNNKKEAQQRAAENALALLQGASAPWPDGD